MTLPLKCMRKRGFMINGLVKLIDFLDGDNLTMAEIGSYTGESTKIFADSGKFKTIYAIDPWQNGYDSTDQASFTYPMEEVEAMFDNRMEIYSSILKKIKSTSKEASELFEIESFDFVYIDGCHLYGSVKEDIQCWLPKVKHDGYLGGHDFNRDGCCKAVTEIMGKPDKTFRDTSWIKRKQ